MTDHLHRPSSPPFQTRLLVFSRISLLHLLSVIDWDLLVPSLFDRISDTGTAAVTKPLPLNNPQHSKTMAAPVTQSLKVRFGADQIRKSSTNAHLTVCRNWRWCCWKGEFRPSVGAQLTSSWFFGRPVSLSLTPQMHSLANTFPQCRLSLLAMQALLPLLG